MAASDTPISAATSLIRAERYPSRVKTRTAAVISSGNRSWASRLPVISGSIDVSESFTNLAGEEGRGNGQTASRRVLAPDAAPGPGPDRPRLRRADTDTGAGRRGRVLARALHPGVPRGLWRDAGPVPDPAPGGARLRAAYLRQPDRDRDLPARRVRQPGHVQRPVRRDHRPDPDRLPGQGGRRGRPGAHPRLLRDDVPDRPASGGPAAGDAAAARRTRHFRISSPPWDRRTVAAGPLAKREDT